MTGKISAWLFSLFSPGFQTTDTTVPGGRQAGRRRCRASAGSPRCWAQTSSGGGGESTAPNAFRWGLGGPSGRLPRAGLAGAHGASLRGHTRGPTAGTCRGARCPHGSLCSARPAGAGGGTVLPRPCGGYSHTQHLLAGLGSSVELGLRAKRGANKHWQDYY